MVRKNECVCVVCIAVETRKFADAIIQFWSWKCANFTVFSIVKFSSAQRTNSLIESKIILSCWMEKLSMNKTSFFFGHKYFCKNAKKKAFLNVPVHGIFEEKLLFWIIILLNVLISIIIFIITCFSIFRFSCWVFHFTK